MACELCSASVSVFTRKKCPQCQRIHCAKCSRRTSSAKVCALCFRLITLSFTRQDLDQYSVKELRNFLVQNNYRSDNFTERADVVEAVMRLCYPGRHSVDDIEHVRHVEQLKERMMRENSRSQSSTSSPASQTSGSHLEPESNASFPPSVSSGSRLESEPDTPLPPSRSSQVNENIPSMPPDGESSSGAFATQPEPPETSPSVSPELSDTALDRSAPTSDQGVGTPSKRLTLSQVATEDDLENLSVRQLKELLLTNFVDYRGCCERKELMERVRRLWLDNQKNKGLGIQEQNSAASADADLCKVCMDAVIDCILLECGHMVTCTQCGKRMAECPICRHYVSRVVRVFKA